MITVLLQAMKEDPPLDQKCRDKFLVQSVLVPADKEFSNVTAIVCSSALPSKENGIKPAIRAGSQSHPRKKKDQEYAN